MLKILPNSKVAKLPVHTYPALDAGKQLSGMPALLYWAQQSTKGFPGVEIKNFTSSWQNGLAFAALIAHWRPDLLDYFSLDPVNPLKTLQLAFSAAEKAGISMLIDAEDVVAYQDDKSIKTQLTMYHEKLSKDSPAPRPWASSL